MIHLETKLSHLLINSSSSSAKNLENEIQRFDENYLDKGESLKTQLNLEREDIDKLNYLVAFVFKVHSYGTPKEKDLELLQNSLSEIAKVFDEAQDKGVAADTHSLQQKFLTELKTLEKILIPYQHLKPEVSVTSADPTLGTYQKFCHEHLFQGSLHLVPVKKIRTSRVELQKSSKAPSRASTVAEYDKLLSTYKHATVYLSPKYLTDFIHDPEMSRLSRQKVVTVEGKRVYIPHQINEDLHRIEYIKINGQFAVVLNDGIVHTAKENYESCMRYLGPQENLEKRKTLMKLFNQSTLSVGTALLDYDLYASVKEKDGNFRTYMPVTLKWGASCEHVPGKKWSKVTVTREVVVYDAAAKKIQEGLAEETGKEPDLTPAQKAFFKVDVVFHLWQKELASPDGNSEPKRFEHSYAYVNFSPKFDSLDALRAYDNSGSMSDKYFAWKHSKA